MDSFIGSLLLVAYNWAPQNWALCNGQLLPINQNQALFSLLGTTYGGDGTTNFALPNLTGPTDVSGASLTWIIAVNGIYPSRP
jgi:microcystin-dependent protein